MTINLVYILMIFDGINERTNEKKSGMERLKQKTHYATSKMMNISVTVDGY